MSHPETHDAVADTVEGASALQQNAQSSSWMLDSQGENVNGRDASDSPAISNSESAEPRENRFPGAASTWRHHTVEERAVVTSLDQLRAEDLSVHLYNAHALKARLYDADTAKNAKPWSSKQQWMQRNDEGEIAWHPDQHWTAWPLPAEDVPRPSEGLARTADHEDVPMTSVHDLEGELLAAMMRTAKRRFKRRSWATPDLVSEPVVVQNLSQVPAQNEAHTSSPPGMADETRNDGKLMERSQELPALLADDEVASALLHPATTHIMSKLDSLLTAFHRSRLGHVKSSQADPISSDGMKSQKRKRRDTTELERASDEHGERSISGGESHLGPAKPSTRSSGKHALRCRDWSEVLGAAALIGWDPVVLDRAAARCSTLFGEDMTFRVMPETSVDALADREVQYRPEIVPDLDSGTDYDDDRAAQTADDEYICPVPSCPHSDTFEHRWRLHGHLRKNHGYSREDVEALNIPSRPARAQGARSMSGTPDITFEGAGNDFNIGGVHTDGFMLPITARLMRGKDRSPRRKRGAKSSLSSRPQSSRRTTSGD